MFGFPKSVNAGPSKAGTFSDLLHIPSVWGSGRVRREEGSKPGCPVALSVLMRAGEAFHLGLELCALPPCCCPKLATSPSSRPGQVWPRRRHLNAFPLRIKHRGAGQESTRSVSEKTRSDLPTEEGRGETPGPRGAGLFFFDFSFKKKEREKKKKFFEP